MHQHDEAKDPLKEARGSVNLLVGVSQTFSMPVRIWLTKFGTAGEMYFGGFHAILGWLALLL